MGPTDIANLPVWVLDGKEEIAPLMKFSFPPNLAKCVVMLCASLEQPGNILPALRRWYRLLDEQIRQHYQPEDIVQARQAREFRIIHGQYNNFKQKLQKFVFGKNMSNPSRAPCINPLSR